MSPAFFITAIVTILAAATVMSLRNLVHCALAMAITFSGIAAIYLQLNAEFVGFAEILVYVGAIAILIVFAILLTRSGEAPEKSVLTAGWAAGLVVAVLGWSALNSTALPTTVTAAPEITVKHIGEALMGKFILPLEIVALVLTAAMIGAVIIALKEDAKTENPGRKS